MNLKTIWCLLHNGAENRLQVSLNSENDESFENQTIKKKYKPIITKPEHLNSFFFF